MKFWKKPTPDQVTKATALLSHAEQRRYFFDRLENPEWIEPLKQKGFFQKPPSKDLKKRGIFFPPWPESRYLARMASKAPETVLEVMKQIQDTDNVRVHEDLVDAACAMPAELAALWTAREIDWIDKQQHLYFILPEKLAELMSHLARGGQIEIALNLGRSLLAILPPSDEEIDKFRKYKLSPDPRARLDIWDFKEILKKNFPDLLEFGGILALLLLCDLVEDAIRLSRDESSGKIPEDFSYIWRPAIEDHEQNSKDDLKSFLVEGVRDAAEALVETNGKVVLGVIEKRPYKIFQRIGLYLRRKLIEIDPEGTSTIAFNQNIFEDNHLQHEYFHLLQDKFASFLPEAQQGYLALVEAGPDINEWLENAEKFSGKRPDAEEAKKYFLYWQYKKLWPIRAFLNGEWLQRFQTFKAEFGDIEHPDFPFYHGGATWVGPTSPKGLDELRSMSLGELIAFLSSWQPSGERISPSFEGLGRELSALVELEPERFATEADRFRGLDPTYIRWLLNGLHSAIRKGVAFSWKPVINLCRWVIDQPREIPGRKGEYSNLDPGWVWTRKTIASLLEEGFTHGIAEIPIALAKEVWEVLRPLTDDPEPTLEYEQQYDGSNMDPATISINTTRGEAMHAVVRYALWVRRHIETLPDKEQRLARGFGEMPEVEEILNRHLNPEFDASPSVRSVYGRWYPWLLLLDKNWAINKVQIIFPENKDLQDLRSAAWETYICFCRPYDDVLDALQPQYARAVDELSLASRYAISLGDPKEKLAEHLMSFYWRGKINLDDPSGLLSHFYINASDEVLAQAMGFLGRSLYETKELIPQDILDRLRVLWEHRLGAKAPNLIEIVAFGWWFASKKFEDLWAICQLKKVLEVAKKVSPDHLVIERIAELCSILPGPSVECLSLMVEGDEEGWNIYHWREEIRIVISTAIKSEDINARQIAITLINRLGGRGYMEFRDLLYQ